MSPFEKAQLRLDQALARLEQALAQDVPLGGSGETSLSPQLNGEVRELRADCEALRRQLEANTERHVRLQAVIGEVSGRLDLAINELDDLLER